MFFFSSFDCICLLLFFFFFLFFKNPFRVVLELVSTRHAGNGGREMGGSSGHFVAKKKKVSVVIRYTDRRA